MHKNSREFKSDLELPFTPSIDYKKNEIPSAPTQLQENHSNFTENTKSTEFLNFNETTYTTQSELNSSKSENSLHGLTKKFLSLLKNSPDKSIDLKSAAYYLNVPKRRVYDITNVLEGLDLLEKTSVNVVRWIGPDEYCDDDENKCESNVLLNGLCDEIAEISDANKDLMFVTVDDLEKTGVFENKHAFIVKTNEDVKIEYVNSKEVCVKGKKDEKVEVLQFKTSK